ncbi:hypothetical protein HDU98_002779 [Podochytrium sp. JEL0797]|nr:hypothetical protein HDU98_002779 [Podochytrium sp. JEL0797]
MGPFAYLLGLCLAMFSGAFLAGSIPLAFSFSESRLVIVSTFGSGLLLGTAFSVILPEGVETLYSAAPKEIQHPPVTPTATVKSSADNAVPKSPAKAPDVHANHVANHNNAAQHNNFPDLDSDAEVEADLDDDEVLAAPAKPKAVPAVLEKPKPIPVVVEKPAPNPNPAVPGKPVEAPAPLDKNHVVENPVAEKPKHIAKPQGQPTKAVAPDDGKVVDGAPHEVAPVDNAPKPIPNPIKDTYTLAKRAVPVVEEATFEDDHSSHKHGSPSESAAHIEPQKYIGPSLVLGFLLMLLIDQLGAGAGHAHEHGRKNSMDHSHGGAEEKGELIGSQPHAASSSSSGMESIRALASGSSSATIGLIVHAAADGIALGAALSSDASNLGFIVFLAIMLHKAPSAFGLTTHLLRTLDPRGGISKRARIRSQLFLFSISAPIGAILTYSMLVQLGFEDAVSMRLYTGSALLFSAGTFLYAAAVHVLPEIYNEEGKLSRVQIVALIAGMFLPYFMTVEHSH